MTLRGLFEFKIDPSKAIPLDQVEPAAEIVKRDAKVDAFYDSVFRNFVSYMVENPATISSVAQLMFVARNIERIGDHATNIAEMVHYAATGTYLPERDEVQPPS
jgi:phosphate transport system protein